MQKTPSQLPLGKILAGMGISTLLLSIGLFFLITNSRSASVASAPLENSPSANGLGPADLSGPPPSEKQPADVAPAVDEPPAKSAEPAPPAEPAPAPVSLSEPPPEVAAVEMKPTPSAPVSGALEGATGIAPSAHAEWEKLMGLQGTLEGIVQQQNKSGSGKTRYLYFSANRKDAMVYMLVKDVGDELSLEFLASLRGKRVRVTGKVERQFGTNRLGLKIKSASQIEVVE